MLVEDNSELIIFIADSLSGQYRILTAANGRQGLELAQRELPDLVVSDVMMPEMDGYQLTHQLKNNPVTDHIAVLLRTARSDVEHRREGLLEGANDYLTNPFGLTELMFQLRNMVSRQQKLRDYYQRSLIMPDPKPTLPVLEANKPATLQDFFINKLYTCSETHLDESALRAESLADDMAMRVRTLTRKLHSLVGVNPARLVRTYRLRRACELLRNGHPVSETAHLVGFEHPTNFATGIPTDAH